MKWFLSTSWMHLKASREVISVCFLLVLIFCLIKTLFPTIKVEGDSMLPTIGDNSYHIYDKYSYLFSAPQRGDIIIIDNREDKDWLIKRIIAMPEERISISNSVVFINGIELKEDYVIKIKPMFPWDMREIKLNKNYYYVIGDNRSITINEHTHGAFNRIQIIGKFFF